MSPENVTGDLSLNKKQVSKDPTQAKRNEFKELYASANEELYPGCDYLTRLDFMVKFTYFKAKGKLTDSTFNEILEFFQNVFPIVKVYKLPPSYYAIKNTFKTIGLKNESIHACVNDCFLFRGVTNKDVHFYPVCNTSRWKDSNTLGKKVPKNVLRYFLIIPRLQRLYKSSHAAKEMNWHATGICTKPDPPREFSRDVIMTQLAIFPTRMKGKHPRFGDVKIKRNVLVELNWTKRSILYELEYWSFLTLKHNLDVMHIEKNSKMIDIICNLELIYPPPFFDIMIHLVIHLPLEDIFGGPIRPWWMYPFERYMKKLKNYIRNKAKPEGSTAKGYVAEKALTIGSYYFRDVTTKFNRPDHNVDCPPPTYQCQIRQHHINNDPCVIKSSELFALACGQSRTPISVNSYVVNSVRFVVHSRDERRITQNSGICSPGPNGEMYYDMARRPLGWKVVEHVSHKKFSNRGVIVLEDDPDVTHVDNSSDLVLSTSLNDFKITALNIDGQSIEVDAPPDIIDVVDEDDDIIDQEDPIPHDLTGFDDDDLVNLDIKMSADVAWSHGSDGGGDDRKGTQKPNLGGRRAGRLHTHQETRNLSLKAIMDKRGPVPILFKVDDRETLMPLGDNAAHWANYLGKLVPEEDESYDLERIRRRRPSHISEMETSATREYPSLIHTFFLAHTVRGVFLNPEDKALYDEMLRLQGLGSNTPTGVPYTKDEIMAVVRGGKRWGNIPGVGRPEYGSGNGSGECGDDERRDDEDGGEDENMLSSDVARERRPGRYPIRAFPFDVSRVTCRPGNLSPSTSRPGFPGIAAEENDEEHLVDEVEVNMSSFKFKIDREHETEFIDPIQPYVNVTEDDLEVLDFDSLESDQEDVPRNARSMGLRKLRKKPMSSGIRNNFYVGKKFPK
nr:hypothetical protein [Tanacetum cinerariifolium]